MKNTSIFIPIILIGCLAAVIYLFFTALSASDQDRGGQPDRIVLNEEDYRMPTSTAGTDDATTNGGTEAGKPADFSAYFEEVPEDEKILPEDEKILPEDEQVTPEDKDETPTRTTTTSPPATQPATTTTTTRPATTGQGRYLVIAGTFSQAEGAERRVAALRAAGFANARPERFNRGSYAVALAGQYDRYSRAQALADEIAGKGFEVKVMKRR